MCCTIFSLNCYPQTWLCIVGGCPLSRKQLCGKGIKISLDVGWFLRHLWEIELWISAEKNCNLKRANQLNWASLGIALMHIKGWATLWKYILRLFIFNYEWKSNSSLQMVVWTDFMFHSNTVYACRAQFKEVSASKGLPSLTGFVKGRRLNRRRRRWG